MASSGFDPVEFIDEKSSALKDAAAKLMSEGKSRVLREHKTAIETLERIKSEGVSKAASHLK